MVTVTTRGSGPDLVERYTLWMRAAGRAESTIRTRQRQAVAIVGHVDPLHATMYDLIEYMARPNWKPATRAANRASVRMFFGWLVEAGYRQDDPSARLPSVKVPAGRPRPASEDALRLARRMANGPYERMMVELAARAGLRRAEIATLKFSDLEVEPDGGYALRVTGKGGVTRVVPIPMDLAHGLLDLRRDDVFPGRHPGQHVSPNWVGETLSRLLGQGYSAHMLRHRYATSVYQHTHDVLAVQALLGHASVATSQVYARPTAADLREASLAAS